MSHYRIRSGCDLGVLFLTLKTFSAISTHMMNICAKFAENLFSNWWELALHEIKVFINRQADFTNVLQLSEAYDTHNIYLCIKQLWSKYKLNLNAKIKSPRTPRQSQDITTLTWHRNINTQRNTERIMVKIYIANNSLGLLVPVRL